MNKIKYTTALLLGGLLSFSSCTDNFTDFNSTDGAIQTNYRSTTIKPTSYPSPPFRKASSTRPV